jgi:hypothetical protein
MIAGVTTTQGEPMFPEYRDLITRLKGEGSNPAF